MKMKKVLTLNCEFSLCGLSYVAIIYSLDSLEVAAFEFSLAIKVDQCDAEWLIVVIQQ